MRIYQYFIAAVVFSFMTTGLASAAGTSAEQDAPKVSVIDMVIASVDGDPITMGDLRQHVTALGNSFADNISPNDERFEQYVSDLVLINLLEKEAKTAGITVAEEEVDAYVEEIQRQNGVDDQAFLTLLKSRGLTLEDYQKQVRSDILRTRIVSSRVRSKVSVADEDVERYLEEHSQLKPRPGEVHLSQILFKVEEGSDVKQQKQLKRSLEDIRARAIAGEDWQSLVTDGPEDLGYVDESDLLLNLREAIAGLEPEGISEVVETKMGYHLLKLIWRSTEASPVDSVLKNQIKDDLYKVKFERALEKFLHDELPKKYHVEMRRDDW